MNSPLLQVKNLSVSFNLKKQRKILPILNNISFSLKAGESLGIIGESGSGKSVTLLSLMGLISSTPGITSGEIWFDNNGKSKNVLSALSGSDNSKFGYKKSKQIQTQNKISMQFRNIRGKFISMIFQDPQLAFNPYYSIGKQISEMIILHTDIQSKQLAKEKAIQWLAMVKMQAPAMRYNNNPFGLSGGMCQRAMIAMALSSQPRILIADEPTTGLDATIQTEIIDLLLELQSSQSQSMIIVSHDINVIYHLSNYILVYYNGYIVEAADKGVLLNKTQYEHHPYTNMLLNNSHPSGVLSNIKTLNSSLQSDSDSAEMSGCPFYKNCAIKPNSKNSKCKNQLPQLFNLKNNHKIRCWEIESYVE